MCSKPIRVQYEGGIFTKMFMDGCKAYSAEKSSESAKLAETQMRNSRTGMCKGIIFANKKEKIKIGKHLSTPAGSIISSAKPTGASYNLPVICYFPKIPKPVLF